MSELSEIRHRLLELCLELKAVLLDMSFPFRWASGYMMPIYNDSRLLLSRPEARELIADGLELLLREAGCGDVEHIAGVATGGIAHAALLAQRLRLPMEYVRSSAKAHGLLRKIEGLPAANYKGRTVAVVEDVVSTGESSLQAIEAVRRAGGAVRGCFVIYSYAFPYAKRAFTEAGLSCRSILSFPQLLEYIEQQRSLSSPEIDTLRQWHRNPFSHPAHETKSCQGKH